MSPSPDSKQLKRELVREGITVCPTDLVDAWCLYVELFGEPPHGTKKQMAALLELIP